MRRPSRLRVGSISGGGSLSGPRSERIAPDPAAPTEAASPCRPELMRIHDDSGRPPRPSATLRLGTKYGDATLSVMHGDADIASIGALVADRGRARILLALGDGRALPATVLADEAGVAASTTSAHLSKLVKGGLLTVERHGRHRYFRLAGPEVADLLEALARLSPSAPVRSLRQGTDAQAVRHARTCYDHLAGMLGTKLMSSMLERELLIGGDGVFDPDSVHDDRLAAPGFDLDYTLTPRGVE